MRQMGNLHPMKLLMAIKWVGAAAVKGFVFSCTLQRRLCEYKKNPKPFDFHSDGFLCKLLLLAGVFWLVWMVFAWPFGGIFSMWPLTVESQLTHFSQMCSRARRPQILIKIGRQSSTDQLFGFQPCWKNSTHFSRLELVVEDFRLSWSFCPDQCFA